MPDTGFLKSVGGLISGGWVKFEGQILGGGGSNLRVNWGGGVKLGGGVKKLGWIEFWGGGQFLGGGSKKLGVDTSTFFLALLPGLEPGFVA